MELKNVIEAVNEGYKEAQKAGTQITDAELTRNFLLNLSTFGFTAEQMKVALCGAVPNLKIKPSDMAWKTLEDEIYTRYMLDIGTEENPLIKPSSGCWLNLYDRTLSTVKHADFFTGEDFNVWLEDYKAVDEDLKWYDIVE